MREQPERVRALKKLVKELVYTWVGTENKYDSIDMKLQLLKEAEDVLQYACEDIHDQRYEISEAADV